MLRNYPITRAYISVAALLAVVGSLWLLVGHVSDGSPMTTVFLALGILTMPLSQVFGGVADVAPVVPLFTGFVANTACRAPRGAILDHESSELSRLNKRLKLPAPLLRKPGGRSECSVVAFRL